MNRRACLQLAPLFAAVLAACGGSSDDSAAGGPASIMREDAPRLSATNQAWHWIASEWQPVNFPDASARNVRFGHASHGWVFKTVTSTSLACTVDFFGSDPARGVVKSCEVDTAASTPPPAAGWQWIANEWQTLVFPNATTRNVRFGHANHGWVYDALTGSSLVCTVDAFGSDPARGIVKSCEIDNSVGAVLTAAPSSPAPSSPAPPPPSTPPAVDGTATLSWAAPTTGFAGYRVYYGQASRSYQQSMGTGIDVGTAPGYTVTGLTRGRTYYFAVTTFDTDGNESVYSGEVSKAIAP